MFTVVFEGLSLILQWPSPLYMVIGVLIGLLFGAVPGLGGLTALALLLPFTYSMDAVPAFALLIGMFAVITTSDTITAILLGVPGTAAAQATVLDGYPMALRGEAARAMGSSCVGGVLGAVLLAVSIPIVRPLVLAFASPEFFAMALLGLTMVGSLSGRSMLKGLSSAGLGVVLATVGYSVQGSTPRFTLDQSYLMGGLPLVPLVLGLFSLPQLMGVAVKGGMLTRGERGAVRGGLVTGIMDAVREWWLVLRSTVLGVYVGLLPGIGGSVTDWLAYGHAVQTSRNRDQYGKGDVRGVIAPEAANNAMRGGDLIHTVAFGIPGSASMAVLLGAFLIHGLEPGPEMLTTHLDFTFSLVWLLVIANVLGAGLLMLWAKQAAKVADIPGHMLVGVIVPIMFMSTWLTSNGLGDWMTLLGFAVLGYVMQRGDWPRPPLILGFLLGRIMESQLFISVQTYGAFGWLRRPFTMALLTLAALVVLGSIYRYFKPKAKSSLVPEHGELMTESEHEPDMRGSLVFGGLLALFFVVIATQSAMWPRVVGGFPLCFGIAGAALTGWVVLRELTAWRRLAPADRPVPQTHRRRREWTLLAWLYSVPLVTLFIGQPLALVLFVVSYLRAWGHYSWRSIAIFTVVLATVIYVLFELLAPVVWYESLFF
jgi:TctA family transporter